MPPSLKRKAALAEAASSSKVAKSLDAAEVKEANDPDGFLHWYTLEPAESSTFEVVQVSIKAGMRLMRTDLVRLNTGLKDKWLQVTMAAMEPDSNRLYLPDSTFRSVLRMQQFFRLLCEIGNTFTLDSVGAKEMVHAGNALDLLHNKSVIDCLAMLITTARCLPAVEQIDLGKRYRLTEMEKEGHINLAIERVKTPASIEDHLLRTCAPTWLPLVGKGAKAEKVMREYLATRKPTSSFLGHVSAFSEYDYNGSHSETIDAVRKAMGLDLSGK
jgi:hypothetical protein